MERKHDVFDHRYERFLKNEMPIQPITSQDVGLVVFLHAAGRTHEEFDTHKTVLESMGIATMGINSHPHSHEYGFDRQVIEAKRQIQRVIPILKEGTKVGFIGRSQGGLTLIKLLEDPEISEKSVFAIIDSAPAGSGSHESKLSLKALVKFQELFPVNAYYYVLNCVKNLKAYFGEIDSKSKLLFLLQSDKADLVSIYREVIYHDWRSDVRKMSKEIPTIFRIGEKDTWLKNAGYSALKEHPKALTIEVPGVGHDQITPNEMLHFISYSLSDPNWG